MADKQTQLVSAIAEGVHAKLAADFAKMAEQLAKLNVSASSTLGRLETLEQLTSAGGTAAKRNVRAGTAAKGGAKKPAAGKKATATDDDKVTNALLYCRAMMANNWDDAQAIYGTEENLAKVEADKTVATRDKDKDPFSYWQAVGSALWKTALSDEEKDGIRTQFNAWKESKQRAGTEAQLDEEDVAE